MRALLFLCLLLTAIVAAKVSPAQVPASPAQRAPISPADFAAEPFLSDPLISPDGRHVAVKLDAGKTTNLGIYRVGQWEEPIRTVAFGERTTLRNFQWATSDRLVVSFFNIQSFGGMKLPATRLASYSIASGKHVALGRAAGLDGDTVVHLDPAGNFLLLESQNSVFAYPGVDRIDLATGAAVQVQQPRAGVTSWFADPSGVVRGGIDYDERRYKIHYRDGPNGRWRMLKSNVATADDSVIEAIRFTHDPAKGFIVTNGPTGRFAAYHYDFVAESVGAPIFEHPSADIDSLIMNDRQAAVDGVHFDDDRPRTHWLNPARLDIQNRIDRALPDRTNMILNQTKDGKLILFWSGSAHDPGAYYLFDRPARTMKEFARPYERIDPKRLAQMRSVRIPARDGLSMLGYLTVPPTAPAGKLPLIVMPHGGPFARDRWSYDPIVQFLASRGYAVLQPQFRGSTGFGRDYVERGYGQWGLKMQDDVDDAVDWAVREGQADPKRVCIMGVSYGGYSALWGAIRNPERYRCAISIAGVTDLRAMLKYDARYLLSSRYVPQWRRRVAGEERRDLRAVSPLQQAERLRIPVLIAHGEKDSNVPPEQSRLLVKALQSRKADVEAHFYKESGHGLTASDDLADFLGHIEAFLRKHNPAAPVMVAPVRS